MANDALRRLLAQREAENIQSNLGTAHVQQKNKTRRTKQKEKTKKQRLKNIKSNKISQKPKQDSLCIPLINK